MQLSGQSRKRLREMLDAQTYDKYYQDIECLDFEGYDKSLPSWVKIVDDLKVDFVGKSVCDLGSFHGFYAIKAKNQGASNVIGLDRFEDVLEMARNIARSSGVDVAFELWKGGEPTPECDLALVLNMLHHCEDQVETLKNLNCTEAVFEINSDQMDLILKHFHIHKIVQGRSYAHRPSRLLVHGFKR